MGEEDKEKKSEDLKRMVREEISKRTEGLGSRLERIADDLAKMERSGKAETKGMEEAERWILKDLHGIYGKFIDSQEKDKQRLREDLRRLVERKEYGNRVEGETFKTKVVEGNRVTIPEPDRELLGVEPGDLVQVSVRVLKKARDEG